MFPLRVPVIGGYGFFGRRQFDRLSHRPDRELLVGGRHLEKGLALVAQMAPAALGRVAPGARLCLGLSYPGDCAAECEGLVIRMEVTG